MLPSTAGHHLLGGVGLARMALFGPQDTAGGVEVSHGAAAAKAGLVYIGGQVLRLSEKAVQLSSAPLPPRVR